MVTVVLFQSTCEVLILHLGKCPELKCQLHLTKVHVMKVLCASVEGVESRAELYSRFMFVSLFVVRAYCATALQ